MLLSQYYRRKISETVEMIWTSLQRLIEVVRIPKNICRRDDPSLGQEVLVFSVTVHACYGEKMLCMMHH